MEQPIKYIESLGIPVDSFVGAGAYCSDVLKEDSIEYFRNHIKALTGCDAVGNTKQVHMQFSYLCMNAVKQHIQLGAPVIEGCWAKAQMQVVELEKTHPYFFLGADQVTVERIAKPAVEKKPIAVINGVERKKGWKSIEAVKIMRGQPTISKEQFIARCKAELEMTDLGALTYWYNAYESVHGVKPPSNKKRKVDIRVNNV